MLISCCSAANGVRSVLTGLARTTSFSACSVTGNTFVPPCRHHASGSNDRKHKRSMSLQALSSCRPYSLAKYSLALLKLARCRVPSIRTAHLMPTPDGPTNTAPTCGSACRRARISSCNRPRFSLPSKSHCNHPLCVRARIGAFLERLTILQDRVAAGSRLLSIPILAVSFAAAACLIFNTMS